MRSALVYMHDVLAGRLSEGEVGKEYSFCYEPDYAGPPVSRTRVL